MFVLLLSACGYEVPTDEERLDETPVLNVLRGTMTVAGPDDVADAVVVLYDANDPPPPTGTGRPVSFATIPAEDFTSADAGGLRTAPWALTKVPDGAWLVTGLLDVDANFNPITTSNAGSTCGDWTGAYFESLTTYTPATIEVGGGELLDNLAVLVGREVTIQRPAWRYPDGLPPSIPATFGAQFTLESTGVYSEVYELPGPFDGTDLCDTAFWTYVTDADGDGEGDAHPNPNLAASGIKDFWPRIYLQYMGDVAAGEAYLTEGVPLAAAFGVGLPPVNTPTPATSLDVLFAGKAIHRTTVDGAVTEETVEGDAIPRGEWAVTVVQVTGQTWTLPNVLATYGATDAAFDPAAQGGYLTIE